MSLSRPLFLAERQQGSKKQSHEDTRSSPTFPNVLRLARIFHTPSSRDAARARLARRPRLFRPGLYENILPGEESEANNASRARSKSEQMGYEISGLAQTLEADGPGPPRCRSTASATWSGVSRNMQARGS